MFKFQETPAKITTSPRFNVKDSGDEETIRNTLKTETEPILGIQRTNIPKYSTHYLMQGKQIQVQSISIMHYKLVGLVLVGNLAFHKRVFIRYTINNWKSFNDLDAEYIGKRQQQDISVDVFRFIVDLDLLFSEDPMSILGNALEFAVCLEVGENAYWDNHDNLNYNVVFGNSNHQMATCVGAEALETKILSLATIHPSIPAFEYAVRGELSIRSDEIRSSLATGSTSLPFKNVVSCNIGNPQQLGQLPITFFRQVASLVEYPDIMKNPLVTQIYPSDTITRAKMLLKDVGGSIGAYSHSQGVPNIRKRVAESIKERDGYPCDPEDIFLTAGASPAVQNVLQLIIADPSVGIMIPIPQYPLYTAAISIFGGKAVPYYLNEESNWSTTVSDLKSSLEKAKSDGTNVRALCVINPGNPTGQCLSDENIKEIIRFCKDEKMVILADEVYQKNIYMPEKYGFSSFRKVLKSMGNEYENVELFSFNSISKGMIGECGRRGGYFECTGIAPEVKAMLYKLASVSLCPPVQGQIMVDLLMNPPKPGDVSYALYKSETDEIYNSLKRRSKRLQAAFNDLEGVSCNEAQGAMYLFPSILFSENALKAASKANKKPDEFYCMELLNATGVCVVPGTGFCQKSGTWHFRSTFLPPEDQLDEFIGRISVFHAEFMNKKVARELMDKLRLENNILKNRLEPRTIPSSQAIHGKVNYLPAALSLVLKYNNPRMGAGGDSREFIEYLTKEFIPMAAKRPWMMFKIERRNGPPVLVADYTTGVRKEFVLTKMDKKKIKKLVEYCCDTKGTPDIKYQSPVKKTAGSVEVMPQWSPFDSTFKP